MRMNRAMRSFLFALLCLVAGTWLLCSPRQQRPPGETAANVSVAPSAPATSPQSPTRAAAPVTGSDSRASAVGFRTPERLREHFEKHGREFQAATAADYLAKAQALRDAPVGGDVLEVVRTTDGVVSRFDRGSGGFIAFDRDGTIRTFFRPNDGEAYFRRQARRAPAPGP
jgi:hypothetical protein